MEYGQAIPLYFPMIIFGATALLTLLACWLAG